MMKFNAYIFSSLLVLLAACSDNAPLDSASEVVETVALRFRLSGQIVGTRAGETAPPDDVIRAEENEVRTLTYAVFKSDGTRAAYATIDLASESLQTGRDYFVSNLNKDDFKTGTEVFAIANAPQETINTLNQKSADLDTWKALTCNKNLNTAVASSSDRCVKSPLMAGYLKLTGAPAAIITVPVEHVYCRIWFRFAYVGESASLDMDVTSITVTGLPQTSNLFNVSLDPSSINRDISNTGEGAQASIGQEDTGQWPFFGDLTAESAHRTDENGQIIRLTFNPAHPAYQTVCRYPLRTEVAGADEAAQPDFNTASPLRYYLYSYQWAGKTIADDPLITVTYGFPIEEGGKIVTKTAYARLYDESHDSGKQHHGLLRNYTYEVVCQINAASDDLTLQVTSQDWYKVPVTDIPSFD